MDYSVEDALGEAEANYFAASLLTPRYALLALLREGKKDGGLASFFRFLSLRLGIGSSG